jgi:ABC-type lipoprotein release transport system permease subunit
MLAAHVGLRFLRTRRASWLALAAVTLTVAVPIVVLGVMQGFVDVTYRQVRAAESDLVLGSYTDAMPRDPQLEAALRAVPGVVDVAPFTDNFAVMVPQDDDRRLVIGCLAEGIDWQADQGIARIAVESLHPAPVLDLSSADLDPAFRGTGFHTPDWRAHLAWEGLALGAGLTGAPLPAAALDRPTPGAIIGRELVYSRIGQHFDPTRTWQVVIPNGSGGTVGAIRVQLSDTIGTGVLAFDSTKLILPLPYGQRLMNLHRLDEISGYRIRLASEQDLEAVRQRIQQELIPQQQPWHLRSWDQLGSRNLVESLKLQRRVLLIIMIAIQCICVFIVYAVFSTLVAEKRHDIGVLLGLGAQRRQVAGIFLLAGLAACLLGGLLGWGLGWGGLLVLNAVSDWLGVPLFPQDVFYSPDTPISWNPLYPLFFIGVMCGIGILATLLPALKAARIDPVHTLRENG